MDRLMASFLLGSVCSIVSVYAYSVRCCVGLGVHASRSFLAVSILIWLYWSLHGSTVYLSVD